MNESEQFVYGRPPHLDLICKNCGGRFGLHNGNDRRCPVNINCNVDNTNYRDTTFMPIKNNDILREFYLAVDQYKKVRKQLGGVKQINDAWHEVELQLQKLKPLIS